MPMRDPGGGALSAGTSVAFAGNVLQIDVNLDGSFNAADDFQIASLKLLRRGQRFAEHCTQRRHSGAQ